MRMIKAWLLLVVLLSNWVGGLLCFEVSYFIEIHRDMNVLERAIAAEVTEKTGIESTVKIEEAAVPRGHIYSDFFLFSEEMENGETVYYTIENDAKSTDIQQITHREENPVSDSEKAMLFKSLFQEYVVSNSILANVPLEIMNENCFYFNSYQPQPYLSILTPPPNLA
ncbi:MAG: hypothetical protein IPJ74_15735 [Saprospiraceae bacterium]|nr:hypothetical protein [Saprospiraceae bacterium]